jgi:toxin YhaV
MTEAARTIENSRIHDINRTAYASVAIYGNVNKPPTALPARVNGWALYAHPIFDGQLDALEKKVAADKRKDPLRYAQKNAAKRLAAIVYLAFEAVPQDPTRAEYRQGLTLGAAHTHWFRAKFFQQYRLFFRFHREARIIVYAWVNDETSKRAYDSKTDAYRVFKKMLDDGNPPDDWKALLKSARAL